MTDPWRLVSIGTFALTLAAGGAQAQDSDPTIYRVYRGQLMAQGWRPDASFGQKLSSGKPLYRFPEVVCGPQLCSAKWRDNAGAETFIRLRRGYGTDEYRVAPQ